MNKKSFSFLAVGILFGMLATSAVFAYIGGVGGVGGSRGSDGVRVLKLAHALEQSHPVHLAMEFMAARVDEISGGRVAIQIYPNGQLGGETDSMEQLQRGALAMVKTSAATMENFVPEMAVFGLPYIFRDEEHYWKTLNSEIGRELLSKGDSHGLHGLIYYESGARSFYMTDEPILKPEDLAKEKIRVMRSAVSMKMITEMGGSPTPIPWGELYTALQQGMVDGAENNLPSFESSRHYEVAKHFSLNEHTRIPDIVLFSKPLWDTLTAQEQAWVQQAADESVEYQRKLWAEKTQEAIETVQKEGVKIYHPDLEPFRRKMQPMIDAYKGTEIGEYVARIQEVE